MGDWHAFSRAALQRGESLETASWLWRQTHRELRGNPSSPEGEYHHRRRRHVGSLLSRGVPFSEAIRTGFGPGGFELTSRRAQSQKSPAYRTARRNPDVLKLAILAGGAYVLYRFATKGTL